jgi:prepilin-type N-terminal cleavage/methylation domain-containing protein
MRLSLHSLPLFRVCSGWSLFELLIVLALMAIAASVVAPQLYATWQLQSLYDERQRLAQQIRFARLTSLQKSVKVRLCWSDTCGSSVGFLTYLDTNNDAYWQPTETPLSQWQIKNGISFRFNRGSQISFNRSGNTGQSGTMILCASHSSTSSANNQDVGYALVLSSSGRLREKKAPCL